MKLNRRYKSRISDWWWKLDKTSLFLILIICFISSIVVATSSASIAEKIGQQSFYFVKKQVVFLAIASLIIVIISFFNIKWVLRFSWLGFVASLFMMFAVLFFAENVNGAKRWLSIFGQSIQPSEFIKPFFAVITASLIANFKLKKTDKSLYLSFSMYLIISFILVSQPDIGMFCVITAMWASQLFIGGLRVKWVVVLSMIAVIFIFILYFFFPHLAQRIDGYLDPSNEKNFQVNKSLDSFSHGGFLGIGPGEGTVKRSLPDSHTDFVFAVIGEEFGAISCIFLVVLYAIIVLRGLRRISSDDNLFSIYAVSGLLIQFGLQAIVNMGVSVRLLPTKGMTLPLISYGGSSIIAVAVGLGMVLAIGKKKYGNSVNKYKLIWHKA